MTNERNKTVALTVEEATKLTTLLLPIILKNASQIDFAKGSPIVNGKYFGTLKEAYSTLCNNKTINAAILLLLPKLLFKDLRMLDNCHNLLYDVGIRIFCFPTRKELEDYIRLTEENLINFYKILLKEFNLMKFYDYCMKIGGSEIDKDPFEPITINKTENINNFLRHTGNILFIYDKGAFGAYNTYYYSSKFGNISPIIFYTSFYYLVKIINSLLKQYKEVMNNEELKQKINTRVFTHLSVILMILCLSKIMHTIMIILVESYLNEKPIVRRIGINDLQKLLVKTNEIFGKVYLTIFKEKKENIKFLIANYETHPYIDSRIEGDVMHFNFKHYLEEFWRYMRYYFARSKSEESERILRISESIHSLGSEIICKIYENLKP